MSRLMGTALAGALLLLTGCSFDSFSLQSTFRSGPKDEQEVAGSPALLAEATFRSLQNANIYARRTQQGETIKIEGSTQSQNHFTLVFERRAGDKTNVRVEWEKDADPTFWPLVLQMLATVQVHSETFQR
jgi:hypothetical protein